MTSERPRTVVYVGTTLDGFIARPDGSVDWMGEPDPKEDYGWAEFKSTIDGIVIGRATFEKVLGFLSSGYPWTYGELPLTVLTSTMKTVPERVGHNVELSSLAPPALLQDLGKRGRKRVYVDGGRTVQSFLHLGLIDELILTRIPVLIGKGIPLFGPLDRDIRWEHVHTKTFTDGLVKSHYRRRP